MDGESGQAEVPSSASMNGKPPRRDVPVGGASRQDLSSTGSATPFTALRVLHRQRLLAGSSRTAQWARSEAWGQMGGFIRRTWLLLIAGPVACVISMIPLALTIGGWLQGAVIATAFVSGLWMDVLATIVWTGAGNKFMGATGEAWTAQELRRLHRSGWLLVNGVQRDKWGDIDHVLVGPGGVLVVETKWSSQSWPLENYESGFMAGTLKNAANQAHQARKELADSISSIAPGTPVMSAAVLWSTLPSEGIGWITWRDNHTAVVRGGHFRRWLKECLPDEGVAPETVDRVWSELDRRVHVQDRMQEELGQSSPPTLRGLVIEWVAKPLAGSVAAIYFLSLSRFAHSWELVLAASIGSVLLGLAGVRVVGLRRIAIGWTACSAIWTVALTVLLLRDFVAK